MFQYQNSPNFGSQQENPFEVQQTQQQQQGMSPLQGLQMYQQFSGGGGMFGGGGAASGGAAGGSAGGTAGGTAGASGGGMSSGLAAAGPWAALAAVIIGNEYSAKNDSDRGRRSGTQYAKDLLGGKVLEQDAPYWSRKIFGKDDKGGFGSDMEAGAELATLDFSNFWKKAKKGTLGKILDIF